MSDRRNDELIDALQRILTIMRDHPMWDEEVTRQVLLGDYSTLERVDDSSTALTSEVAAICIKAIGSVYSRPE